MNGLFGFACDPRRAPQAPAALAAMQQLALQRYMTPEEPFCDGVVCCGLTRRVGDGVSPQPCASSDGIHVWVSGELYEVPGRSRSSSMGAVPDPAAALLELYRADTDWRFLRRIDGMYAAVIYDSVHGKVHLIGDRYGLSGCFWTLVDGRPAWTSTLGAFLALPGFCANVDRTAATQFCLIGNPLGDRTLFEGVELLAVGTVVTWHADDGKITRKRYWWWDDIRQLEGPVDSREAARELGRLLRAAVVMRCGSEERLGVLLSGGLDSRALVAAMPPGGRPAVAVTFGQPGCLDEAIARRVAEVKGMTHHTVELDADDWLGPRLEAVWWADGLCNVTDMHDVVGRDVFAGLFEVVLDGYGGDMIPGGMYLNGLERLGHFSRRDAERWMEGSPEVIGDVSAFEGLARSDFFFLENRGRRMSHAGTKNMQTYTTMRLPFLDNKVVEFVYSLPDTLRLHGRLYHEMLLGAFPEYYRGIAWQSTGIPIGWPRGSRRIARWRRRAGVRLLGRAGAVGVRGRYVVGYEDYDRWIAREPTRGIVEGLLTDPQALYVDYVSRDETLSLWRRVLAGEKKAEDLGSCVAFEVWLQQVFNGRFRPASDGQPLTWADDEGG